MDEVQSWWEVPCIAHFCSLFRASFDLPDFDIEELEEALLTDSVEEVGSGLLQDLIVRLLKGSFNTQQDEITTSNYQMFLRRLFRQKCEVDVTRKNPFDSDIAFFSLPLRTKVEILNDLCDFRLDTDDITELLKSIEAESLRVEPLGQDSGGSTYWYFYGTRLYREDYHTIHKSPPKKRGRKIEERTVSKWQVVCFTEEDWHLLTSKFKNCKHKDEKNLYATLREDFLPELSRLFAEKERVMRKRMMDKQLRRSRKESPPPQAPQQTSDDDEELKRQRLEQEEADRRLAEEIQRQERAAGRDLRERRGTKPISNSSSLISTKSGGGHRSKHESGGGVRMTNNSMSALLLAKAGGASGDDESNSELEEVEEEPKKKSPKVNNKGKDKKPSSVPNKSGSSKTKVKSSIIFSASEEDVQIGMHKVIEYIKSHRDAWPFTNAVDEAYAPSYYKVIREPMDLQTIEDKLDNQEYLTLDQLRGDFQLIVHNCHKYNGPSSEYTEMVDNLEEAFHKAITRFILPDESDEEISIEYAAQQERKKPRLSQSVKRSPEPRQASTPPRTPRPQVRKIEDDEEENSLTSPPRKKRKKKKNKNIVEVNESERSDIENSEDEAVRIKKKRSKEIHHKKVKEVEKSKVIEINPKYRPVKKRPRDTSSNDSSPPLVQAKLLSPNQSKHLHHKHHHHHKHSSKSHERDRKERSAEHLKKVGVLDKSKMGNSHHREKEEKKSHSVTPLPLPSHPPSTSSLQQPKKPTEVKPKAKKSTLGLLGFKGPNLLNMKRLQVGKATKFKIKSTEEKTKDSVSSGVTGNNNGTSTSITSGGGGGGKGDDNTPEKKRSILLNDTCSERLSFGTVLPKNALPLRDFKQAKSDDEDQPESAEPLPSNPTQEEIMERLEKTFGASLARTTKDQLAKVILAPEASLDRIIPIKSDENEADAENPPRLDSTKGFNREKSLPNLSAWFKAFGAPKLNSPSSTPATPEKEISNPIVQQEASSQPKSTKFSLMGRSVGDWKGTPPKTTNNRHKPIAVPKDSPEEVLLPKDEEGEKDINRKRRMSTSSMSSQSEVGSPVQPQTTIPPRWVENRSEAWVSGSPSASSQVSSQSPAGPNSPFSPPINSPPTPQTPPRPPAPVRVGFYQDYSVHSSPEKTTELNVSSPATPPPAYGSRNYSIPAYGATSPSPSSHKTDESPVQSPQYTPLRTPNYDSGRASKDPPQSQPPTNYGIFPEAAHSGSSRYSLTTPSPAHTHAEPQAAHQYSREPPGAYGRVNVNGQHYGNPTPYSHQPPPHRGMNIYNAPNERFYKSAAEGLGLSILSSSSGQTAPTTSSNISSSSSKSRKEKEPKQSSSLQQQQQAQPEGGLTGVNGFQWPHNLASLTQIVNSIPNAMTGYMNPPPHAHGHYTTTHESPHGYTNIGNSNSSTREGISKNDNVNSAPSPAPSGRRSAGSKGSSESKSNSRSSSSSKNRSSVEVASAPTSSSGMVPGSAFNFSSLSSPELALYSKEMSEYSSSQPSIAHAHHRSELYTSNSPNFHQPFSGGSSVRGTSSYQLGAFHPSAYQGSPSQNYSAQRGMVDHYQGLFQGAPHVFGLPPTGYPPPYPHPHSLPFPNRPGWI